jgi:hypothetical protein
VKSVNPAFLGTVIGLLLVLLLPAQFLNEEYDLFYDMTVFGILGFSIGTLINYFKKRRRHKGKA